MKSQNSPMKQGKSPLKKVSKENSENGPMKEDDMSMPIKTFCKENSPVKRKKKVSTTGINGALSGSPLKQSPMKKRSMNSSKSALNNNIGSDLRQLNSPVKQAPQQQKNDEVEASNSVR